jgi:excisionase family DNA binding protein
MQNETSSNPLASIPQLQLVDAAQCAAGISTPKSTLYRMVREGLPVYRVGPRGRGLRFNMPEVLAWLRR